MNRQTEFFVRPGMEVTLPAGLKVGMGHLRKAEKGIVVNVQMNEDGNEIATVWFARETRSTTVYTTELVLS